ncbi:ester cyclase [Chloroflexota bacterium]
MAISLDSNSGNIFAGGDGADGDIVLKDGTNQNRIRLDAGGGNAWLGGNGADGDLVLFRNSGDNETLSQATIHLDGQQGNIFAGGDGADGDIVLKDGTGQNRIRLDAGGGNIWLGGNGADGDIVLFSDGGDNETLGDATIHLDGQSGDIKLSGSDCAEDFEVSELEQIDPGTVLVVDQEDDEAIPFIDAFPDSLGTIDDIIGEGDKISMRWTFRGTYKEQLRNIAPTGKTATISRFVMFRLDSGKIAEIWVLNGMLNFYQQLGVLPPTEEIGK